MTYNKDTLGIYIHVPFCLRKCPYCDFYSCENRLHERDAFVQAVCRNLRYYSDDINVDTLYFGGGTPSLLSPSHIEEIIKTAGECFCLSDPEITMEMNPATVSAGSLKAYRRAGVNRVSIGVQDLDDASLENLGRLHSADDALRAVYDASDAGFTNISCDIMTGTKGQTMKKLLCTLEKLAELPMQHISAYMLKIEEGTPYAQQNMQNEIPDDDETAEMYLEMVRFLEAHGFYQYEISNFAKKGFESRHNCRYWKLSPYLGIGPAAHSCMGKRFYVPSDLDDFIKSEHQSIITEDESPDTETERIMLGLRLSEGIPCEWLNDSQLCTAEKYVRAGLMKMHDGRISFTPQGFLVSNSVLCEII